MSARSGSARRTLLLATSAFAATTAAALVLVERSAATMRERSLDPALAAMSEGAFGSLTKPFRKDQLLATVGRAMRWHSGQRALRRLEAILALEPHAAAEARFQEEYLERLARALRWGAAEAAKRAGIG